MVTIDTYKARVVKVLYQDGTYPPQIMKVADAVDAIAAPGEKPTAMQAITQTALDDFSPVMFVDGTNQSAISFGIGSVADIHEEAKDWIELYDANEMPPGLS